jgi:DNA replication factor GINS
VVAAIRKEEDREQAKAKSESNNNSDNNNAEFLLKDLHNLLLKEVQISTLQSIPLDTYQNIAIILGNLKEHGYEGIEAKIRDRMAELISISAKLLLETRHQKLIELQQSDEQSASSSSPSTIITEIDYSKLTDEEKYIFDGEKESGKRRTAILTAILKGRSKVLESISGKIRSRQIVVRFIKPMEQFMGINMTKYGPFQEEDVAVIPFENARSFIDNGVAVEIQTA